MDDNATKNSTEEEVITPDEVVEEIEESMDVIGEPESEMDSSVEETLLSAPEEDIVDEGEEVETQEETVEDFSHSTLTEMVNMIDDVSKSLEIQRKMFDAREQLTQVCLSLGIAKDDQDLLNEKFQKDYTAEDIEKITADADRLDAEFFTREDGTIINVTTLTGEDNKYESKKELVDYLHSFYDLERSVTKDLDELGKEIKTFKQEDVASASATVANNLKQGIEDRWAEMEEMSDDDPLKKSKRKLLSRMRSSYTFAEQLTLLEEHPGIIQNTIKDVDNAQRVKDIGKRYAEKLKQGNTFSKLYSTVQDGLDKSIEKQFLHEDDYVAGRENLFAFFLIRFFSTETWTNPNEYTKELHNATCIVLQNLMANTLDTDFRDEVVENIKAVWAKFKEAI